MSIYQAILVIHLAKGIYNKSQEIEPEYQNV